MNQFIPAFKGYERMGQFPLEKNSTFSTRKEAEEYARLGFSGESSAYPGQIITIHEADKISVCVIDPAFKLNGITSSTTVESATFLEFKYTAFDQDIEYRTITLGKESFLKSITVQILEQFCGNDYLLLENAFKVVAEQVTPYGITEEVLLGEEELLTNEIGDFVVYYNGVLNEETRIIVKIANPDKHPFTGGRAILKIN